MAAVFLVGCAVGGVSAQLVVPKASAQQMATLPAWQYTCFTWADADQDEQTAIAMMNKLGRERWELTGGGDNFYCFKRPTM